MLLCQCLLVKAKIGYRGRYVCVNLALPASSLALLHNSFFSSEQWIASFFRIYLSNWVKSPRKVCLNSLGFLGPKKLIRFKLVCCGIAMMKKCNFWRWRFRCKMWKAKLQLSMDEVCCDLVGSNGSNTRLNPSSTWKKIRKT